MQVVPIFKENLLYYMKKELSIKDFILYCWEYDDLIISVYYQKETGGFVYYEHIDLEDFIKWQNPYIRKHKINKICSNRVK